MKTLNVGYIVFIKTLEFLLVVSLIMAIFGSFMLAAYAENDQFDKRNATEEQI